LIQHYQSPTLDLAWLKANCTFLILLAWGYKQDLEGCYILSRSDDWTLLRKIEQEIFRDDVDFPLPHVFPNQRHKYYNYSEVACIYSFWISDQNHEHWEKPIDEESWHILFTPYPVPSTSYRRSVKLLNHFTFPAEIIKMITQSFQIKSTECLFLIISNTKDAVNLVKDCFKGDMPFLAFFADEENLDYFVEYMCYYLQVALNREIDDLPTFSLDHLKREWPNESSDGIAKLSGPPIVSYQKHISRMLHFFDDLREMSHSESLEGSIEKLITRWQVKVPPFVLPEIEKSTVPGSGVKYDLL
jgi:hypothetical protein